MRQLIRAAVVLSLLSAPLAAQREHFHVNPAVPGDEPHPHSSSGAVDYRLLTRDEKVTAQLAEAKQLTGRRQYAEADAAYQAAIAGSVDLALPEYARFLRLTGNTEGLEKLLAGESFKSAILLTQARAMFAAGRQDEGVALLSSAPDVLDASNPSAVLLLARTLGGDKKDELLAAALAKTSDRANRAILFHELFSAPHPVLMTRADLLAPAVDAGLAGLGPQRATIVRLVDACLLTWFARIDYKQYRDEILKQCAAGGAGAHWLHARILVREENHAAALEILDVADKRFREDPLWPLLIEEKAEVLRSLRRVPESQALYETLASVTNNTALVQESARAAIATANYELAVSILDKLDVDRLTADERRHYVFIRVNALSRQGNLPALIDTYGRFMQRATVDDFDTVHSMIFKSITDTLSHRQLEELIRARFQEKPKETPVVLWRLCSLAAEEAGRGSNAIEALYRGVEADPSDVQMLTALAQKAVPAAEALAKLDPATIVAPPTEVENVYKVAEASLLSLAKAQPLDPTAYFSLIDLWKSRSAEDIPDRITNINARRSTDARVIGQAAYALATKGYPKEAIVLYDRALEFDQWEYGVKMNRAACLTRLDRWKEASDTYKDTLENGYRGRNYHVHEMIGRVYDIHAHLGETEQVVTYFKELSGRINPAWRDEAVRDMGNLMANRGRLADAEYFFRKVIDNGLSDKVKVEAYESLGSALMVGGKPEEARKVYEEGAARFGNMPEKVVVLKHSQAEMMVLLGKNAEAAKLMEQIAIQHGGSNLGLAGLYRAGELMELAGQPEEARRLYTAFVASASTDFQKRNDAAERIIALAAPAPAP